MNAPVNPADLQSFSHEARDYEGLLDGLRARVEQLNVSGHTLEVTTGLAKGHPHKIIGLRPTKILGPLSLGAMLFGTGLKLVLVADPEALDLIAIHLEPRKLRMRSLARITWTHQALKARASRGGKAWAAKLTPEQRKSHATRLANIRWRKYRKDRKLASSKAREGPG